MTKLMGLETNNEELKDSSGKDFSYIQCALQCLVIP